MRTPRPTRTPAERGSGIEGDDADIAELDVAGNVGVLQADQAALRPGDGRVTEADVGFIDGCYAIDLHADATGDHEDFHPMPDRVGGVGGGFGGDAVVEGTGRLDRRARLVGELDFAAGDPGVAGCGGAHEDAGVAVLGQAVVEAEEEIAVFPCEMEPVRGRGAVVAQDAGVGIVAPTGVAPDEGQSGEAVREGIRAVGIGPAAADAPEVARGGGAEDGPFVPGFEEAGGRGDALRIERPRREVGRVFDPVKVSRQGAGGEKELIGGAAGAEDWAGAAGAEVGTGVDGSGRIEAESASGGIVGAVAIVVELARADPDEEGLRVGKSVAVGGLDADAAQAGGKDGSGGEAIAVDDESGVVGVAFARD